VPPPVHAPVSILSFALACAAILQILITSLVLCAGSVGGFSNPTPGASPPPGLSPQHPTYPTQPYTWAPPSQTYSSWPGAQMQRGPRPPYWHYDPPQGSGCAATATTSVRVVCVGARWGRWDLWGRRWDPWGRCHELGTRDYLLWTSSDAC
jgi:hypothetical protein